MVPPAPLAATVIDPRRVPVIGHDAHLPKVEAEWLQPSALRRRFSQPPQWEPELRSEPRFTDRAHAEAAVLMTVILHPEPTLLLTQRTAHLSTHSGQIALPGGRVDAGDSSAIAAALREAHEEVGLPLSEVEVLGCLPVYLTGTMYSVTPIVGMVRPGLRLHPNPDEVADVFEVPLAFLLNPAHHRWHEWEHEGIKRRWLSMPYQDGATERYIWGATAGMLRNLYAFLSA